MPPCLDSVYHLAVSLQLISDHDFWGPRRAYFARIRCYSQGLVYITHSQLQEMTSHADQAVRQPLLSSDQKVTVPQPKLVFLS
jgi:hypothetical protein